MRINGSFAQILAAWMQRFRYDNPDLSTRVQLISGTDWLSVEEWRGMLGEAARMTGNPHVGIEIGSSVLVQHAGVLGYLMLNSRSVAEALETYLLCERHFYDVNFGSLQRQEDGWSLSWPDLLGNDNALFGQVSLSALVTFLRQRFSGTCDLLEVAFAGDEPDDRQVYEGFFHCNIQFNSTSPGITFDARTIHQQMNDILHGDYQQMRNHQAQAFSRVIEVNDPFLHRLQHVFLSLMPEGDARLPLVARQMNCSPRTLQRKLQNYNLSFQLLLDGVREQLAFRYLQGTNLTLSEIALLLGFSDQSAFTRAFKSWTGTVPSSVRNVAVA